MVLRNRNFSTAFCSHFYIFPHFSNIFSHVQNAFFAIFIHAHYQNACFSHCLTFVKKCQKNAGKMRFENALRKNVKKCGLKMHLEKNVKKYEKV